MSQLRALAAHFPEAARAGRSSTRNAESPRGKGVMALFVGASGAEMILAAQALAGAMDFDLYRVDLSRVVSKYIGETEKNLSRVFASAESKNAIIFFDEADALFGKRSEVTDSHDRYANVELNYLLQKMEAYHGLSILSTNPTSTLDKEFTRRFPYVVTFPLPCAGARAKT